MTEILEHYNANLWECKKYIVCVRFCSVGGPKTRNRSRSVKPSLPVYTLLLYVFQSDFVQMLG